MKVINGKINFECKLDHCKKCCCGPFSGINSRLSNVEGRPFNEIVLTEEDYDLLYSYGRADLIKTGTFSMNGKKYYTMALNEDGSCKAWIEGRCSINKYKPTLCRAFPFYIDMFSGLCAIMCEGFTDEVCTDMDDMWPSLDAARKMYEFWVKFYRDE